MTDYDLIYKYETPKDKHPYIPKEEKIIYEACEEVTCKGTCYSAKAYEAIPYDCVKTYDYCATGDDALYALENLQKILKGDGVCSVMGRDKIISTSGVDVHVYRNWFEKFCDWVKNLF